MGPGTPTILNGSSEIATHLVFGILSGLYGMENGLKAGNGEKMEDLSGASFEALGVKEA